jgi:hypothetical protein
MNILGFPTVRATSRATSPIDRDDYHTVEDWVIGLQHDWESEHPKSVIKQNRVPAIAQVAAELSVCKPALESAAVPQAIDVVPPIRIGELPAAAYPRHLAFLYRCTMVALDITAPALRATLTSPSEKCIIATVVAIRAGAWAACNEIPHSCVTVGGTEYDRKRERVNMKGGRHAAAASRWVTLLEAQAGPSAVMLELMVNWCVLAPQVCVMAASQAAQQGGAYAVRHVERAISTVLKARLSTEAYNSARLKHNVLWDAARQASIGGWTRALVGAWAIDPAIAIYADRRLLSEPDEIAGNQRALRRALSTRSRFATASATALPTPPGFEEEVRDALATMRGSSWEPDDDTLTVATDVSVSRPETPPHEEEVHTVVPSRSRTPEIGQEITAAQRMEFHQILAGAHSADAGAQDFSMGLDDEIPLE